MAFDGLLSVVIPVYRSEAYLSSTVGELVRFLEPRARFEIILVNDGSPDGVQRVIDELRTGDERIRSITLGRNLGQHRATLQGFARTRGDIVVTIDDDGQNPPDAAWAVADALLGGGYDVVYGQFQSVEQSLARRLASRANRWVSERTIGNRGGIAISNVRAIRGELARALSGSESPYPYIDALVFRATQHVGQVPVQHRRRSMSGSNYGVAKLLRLSVSHFTTLTVLPLKVATAGCFGASAFGLVIGVVELVRALGSGQAPPGWLSIFCALTFLFSLLFAFLGILSVYLGRMYVTLNERGLVWTRSSSAAEEADAPRTSSKPAERSASTT